VPDGRTVLTRPVCTPPCWWAPDASRDAAGIPRPGEGSAGSGQLVPAGVVPSGAAAGSVGATQWMTASGM
jgi:hypothetical protein